MMYFVCIRWRVNKEATGHAVCPELMAYLALQEPRWIFYINRHMQWLHYITLQCPKLMQTAKTPRTVRVKTAQIMPEKKQ